MGAITIDEKSYYPPADAAEILGQSVKTLESKRSRGTGCKFIKDGKAILYKGADLIAHLEARRVQHGAEYRDRFERPPGKGRGAAKGERRPSVGSG